MATDRVAANLVREAAAVRHSYDALDLFEQGLDELNDADKLRDFLEGIAAKSALP